MNKRNKNKILFVHQNFPGQYKHIDYYLAKNVSIPQGSSMEFIDGGAKVVLLSGDAVKVKSDTASSADCWLSYIDSIST